MALSRFLGCPLTGVVARAIDKDSVFPGQGILLFKKIPGSLETKLILLGPFRYLSSKWDWRSDETRLPKVPVTFREIPYLLGEKRGLNF